MGQTPVFRLRKGRFRAFFRQSGVVGPMGQKFGVKEVKLSVFTIHTYFNYITRNS